MKPSEAYGVSIPSGVVVSLVVVEVGICLSLLIVSLSFFLLRRLGKVNTSFKQVIGFHIIAIFFSLLASTSYIIDIFTEKSSSIKIIYVSFFTSASFLHVLLPFRPLYVWIDGLIGRRVKWRFALLPLECIVAAVFTAANLFETIQITFFPDSQYNASIVAATALILMEVTIVVLFYLFLYSILNVFHLSLFSTVFDALQSMLGGFQGCWFCCGCFTCCGFRHRDNNYNNDGNENNDFEIDSESDPDSNKTLLHDSKQVIDRSRSSSNSSSSSTSTPLLSSSSSIIHENSHQYEHLNNNTMNNDNQNNHNDIDIDDNDNAVNNNNNNNNNNNSHLLNKNSNIINNNNNMNNNPSQNQHQHQHQQEQQRKALLLSSPRHPYERRDPYHLYHNARVSSASLVTVTQYQTIRRVILVCVVVLICSLFGITKGIGDIIAALPSTASRSHSQPHHRPHLQRILYIIGGIGESGTLIAALMLALALTVPQSRHLSLNPSSSSGSVNRRRSRRR